MIKHAIALVAASGLAAKLIHHLSQKQQLRRTRDEHKRHHEEVSRWEDEGGNVPEVKPPPAR